MSGIKWQTNSHPLNFGANKPSVTSKIVEGSNAKDGQLIAGKVAGTKKIPDMESNYQSWKNQTPCLASKS